MTQGIPPSKLSLYHLPGALSAISPDHALILSRPPRHNPDPGSPMNRTRLKLCPTHDEQHRPCPFGGRVVIQGPYLSGGLSYRVSVKSPTIPEFLLTGPIYIYETEDGFKTVNPTNGWYPYSDVWHNIDNVLAYFDT